MLEKLKRPKEQFNVEFDKFLKEYELHRIHDSFFERTSTLVIAAVGLIAALAWDDAIKQLFEDIFGEITTTGEKIFFAIVLTAMAVVISLFFGRMIKRRRAPK